MIFCISPRSFMLVRVSLFILPFDMTTSTASWIVSKRRVTVRTMVAIRSHTNLLRVTDWSGKRSRHGYGRLGLVGAYMRSASAGLRPKALRKTDLTGRRTGLACTSYRSAHQNASLRATDGPPPPAEPRHVALKITSLAAARTDPRSLIQTTITRAASR
ncbi:hypothetical protein C8Q74DRAFT_870481 [Fomes fomentarius]|nr:hypothetical protein C8Q74DRAFT_870481 [Fomes fomentarius]